LFKTVVPLPEWGDPGNDSGGHWEITGQIGETKPAMSGKSTTNN
jgi:hypothetical protein